MDSISNPPFQEAYKTLMNKIETKNRDIEKKGLDFDNEVEVEECELPVIDVSLLEESESDGVRREECKCEIARASKYWGFFLVVNHGIPNEVLNNLRVEQEMVFKQPFDEKAKGNNFSAGSYRWGNSTATCARQFSWSESFHIPLTDILGSRGPNTSLTSTVEQYSSIAYSLAQTIADILAEKMGHKSTFFQENCKPTTCYLRLNRYPPFPMASEVHGLVPHTDSDFLTILHQDQVRGLQLLKDGKWIAVKPNPDALIINIGDLFQAWSNGVYKSVEHRVVTNPKLERFSMAYFFCPFNDTIIESCTEPPIYRKFSYREYRQQVRDDVQKVGTKIGLPNFLIHEGTA